MSKEKLIATYHKWIGNHPVDRWLTIAVIVAMVIMFITALTLANADAHDIPLSSIGLQTVISSTPCPILSGYLIESEELGCYLIYKHIDLSHSGLHVQKDFPRDEDGDCACPTVDE